MHFRTLVCTLLLATPCCVLAQADEEITFARESPCARATHIERDVPCFEDRARLNFDLEQNVESTTQAEYISVPTRHCQAVVTMDVKQKNRLATIDGRVANDTCGASRGSFVLSVRTSHNGGEQATTEYMQSWAREDDQPIRFNAEYPIPEDVTLVVRAQRVQCTCATVP